MRLADAMHPIVRNYLTWLDCRSSSGIPRVLGILLWKLSYLQTRSLDPSGFRYRLNIRRATIAAKTLGFFRSVAVVKGPHQYVREVLTFFCDRARNWYR